MGEIRRSSRHLEGRSRMKPRAPSESEGFLEELAHRLGPEGWVGRLSLKWGPRGGADLGEMLRRVGDIVGVRGLGTP